jgi:hypothetical protein
VILRNTCSHPAIRQIARCELASIVVGIINSAHGFPTLLYWLGSNRTARFRKAGARVKSRNLTIWKGPRRPQPAEIKDAWRFVLASKRHHC